MPGEIGAWPASPAMTSDRPITCSIASRGTPPGRSKRGAPAVGIGADAELTFDQGVTAIPDLEKARKEELERQEQRKREFEKKQAEAARLGKLAQ